MPAPCSALTNTARAQFKCQHHLSMLPSPASRTATRPLGPGCELGTQGTVWLLSSLPASFSLLFLLLHFLLMYQTFLFHFALT